ncbi:dual specificity phosphatase 13-like [Pelobates cultripes]|uniref:Dual specificity protein phosphatase n=1 Tax=Pelobates cultripes TaxID=61616 RepID=A0AAD1TD01_PELCU|nr:dual specificity phosphatase 13-like [Pelobates cultripes]
MCPNKLDCQETVPQEQSRRRLEMPVRAMTEQRYRTPSIRDLENVLYLRNNTFSHVDEIVPNLYLGDSTGVSKGIMDDFMLKGLGITHILNAAHGQCGVNVKAGFYADIPICYYGIKAIDDPSFNLSVFFNSTAKFIKEGLESPLGKVLVHCAMGISRSSTLVIAFLMIHRRLSVMDAIKLVVEKRYIRPNNGFLAQLIQLDKQLRHSGV